MSAQTLPNKENHLLPIAEIIRRAKELGFNFGFGDPYNRIRYYIKIGLLPNMVRRSAVGFSTEVGKGKLATQGHLPKDAVEKLLFIQGEREKGVDYPEIAVRLQSFSTIDAEAQAVADKPAIISQPTSSNFVSVNNEVSQETAKIFTTTTNILGSSRYQKVILAGFLSALLFVGGAVMANRFSDGRGGSNTGTNFQLVTSKTPVAESLLSAIGETVEATGGSVLAAEFAASDLGVNFNIPPITEVWHARLLASLFFLWLEPAP
jgi:hypothetical protein